MLKVEVVAKVTYTCNLSYKDEKKVIKYIKDNPDEFEFMTNETT